MKPDIKEPHCSTWNNAHQTRRVLFHVEHPHGRPLLLLLCQALALGGQPSLIVWVEPQDAGTGTSSATSRSPDPSRTGAIAESDIGPMIRSIFPGIDHITPHADTTIGAWMDAHGKTLLSATQGQYDWIFFAGHHAQREPLDVDTWVSGAIALIPSTGDGEAAKGVFDSLDATPRLVVPVEEHVGTLRPEVLAHLRSLFPASLSNTIMTAGLAPASRGDGESAALQEAPESPQTLRAIQLAKELKNYGR